MRVMVSVSSASVRFCSTLPHCPLRYAILGAGFAGLSVAWHLLHNVRKESHLCIDIYDEVGIGGGASGVAGGLIHPYSPKAKLLWRGAECWKECMNMLNIAEEAAIATHAGNQGQDLDNSCEEVIVWRRGILRPATTLKNVDILNENAQNCLESCRIERIDGDSAQNLIPNLCVPLNSAIYMPLAVNIHPQRYLKALFLACENLAKNLSESGYERKEIHLRKRPVNSLLELEGDYDAVIVCLGANTDKISQLSGKIPLRTCRGVVAHMALANNFREEYDPKSPSILSDAWVAAQSSRNLVMGSTWDWNSKDYSSNVSAQEASVAIEELIAKASRVYPSISNWSFVEAKAGLRAMPPLTPTGSIPLLGRIDDIVGGDGKCKYWVFTGLGARGLLYHGWLGKLMAQAIVSCNEYLLPKELTSWKMIQRL